MILNGWRIARPAVTVLKEELSMAYKITDDCVSCGACESECPNNAISEGADMYVIDADACTDCGACAESCPNDAIVAG
ncbi:MAG: DUF362 domain-containing protein [Armatimonadota bacterium]